MMSSVSSRNKEGTAEECVLTVKLVGSLRTSLDNDVIRVRISKRAISVAEFLRLLLKKYDSLGVILDEVGKPKPSFLLFINNVDYALLGGINATLKCGDTLSIVPIVHGG